jgi:hypothetical protein
VCRGSLVKVDKKREKLRNKKKSSKSVINIIFKNIIMIKILAVELLNTIILLVSNDKISP